MFTPPPLAQDYIVRDFFGTQRFLYGLVNFDQKKFSIFFSKEDIFTAQLNYFFFFLRPKSLPVVKGVVLTLERFWGSELEQLLWMDQKEIYPQSNLIIL